MIKLYKPPKIFMLMPVWLFSTRDNVYFAVLEEVVVIGPGRIRTWTLRCSSDGHKARLATQTLQIFQRETSETEPDRQTVVYIDR